MKKKKSGSLIVISGPSGVGKDTICNELVRKHNEICLSISMTTRERRGNEVDGENYFFVTKDYFIKNIENNNLLEYAVVHNEYYGTPKKWVLDKLCNGIDVILLIDIEGALKIKELYKEAIFIFIMPPNMKDLIDRLVKRGTETKEKIESRFRTAYKEINEIAKYNYVVINDKVDNAINKIEAILIAEKCSVSRIEDLELDNVEELIHEYLMK